MANFASTVLCFYINWISNKLWGAVRMPALGSKKGDVLISYLTEPFTKAPWEKLSNLHTNYWECREMARLFAKRGYAVDVINWDDRKFIPKKSYRICVDVQDNLERLAPLLPSDCIKVMHVTTSEQSFQNAAELARLAALKGRRGFNLMPRRQLPSSRNPEIADYLEGFGNETVRATYAKYGKPIFPIPISAVKTFAFSEHKDFEKGKKNFLWLGGGGAVLKGLDLVLEVFARNPDLKLHVCGPVAAEKDFTDAYRKELFETENITYHGRMDVGGTLFSKLASECGALIYPAFSEGTSGAVVQAMHAGLVPLITRESGIAEDAPAIILERPSIETIEQAIRSFVSLSPDTVRGKARSAWSYANAHYTREAFSKAYSSFIDTLPL